MKTKINPPRTAIRGRAGVAKHRRGVERSLDSSSSSKKPSPPRRKPVPTRSLVAPPRVARGRPLDADDFDRKELAGELNHELVKVFSDCRRKEVDTLDWMGERSFREWYWTCHDELFGTLDEIYLLMIEEGVTLAEAEAIASATRKHVHRMIERWRTHHRALLGEILELHEAAERRGGWRIPNSTWAIFSGDSETARQR